MSPITAMTIAGTAVDLSTVAYQVSISHGRGTVTDAPTPSGCEVILTTTTVMPACDIGQVLTIDAYGLPRFTGRISDIRVSHLTDGTGRVTITGTGVAADLGLIAVTPSAWPAEASGARAGRILTAAGFTVYAATGSINVLAKTSDTAYALDLLTELGDDTGAAVVDTPGGAILFQDLEGRAQSYVQDTWATTTGAWSTYTQSWTTMESPAQNEPVTLPAAVIAWEPTLEKHRSDIINQVIVTYGSPLATHIENEATSQGLYGVRAASLDTELADLTAANLRAEQVIARLAFPRWQLGGVQLLVHDLDTPTRAAVMELICGARVVVSGLPDPAPVTNWLGVVEGWAENYVVTRWTDTEATEEHYLTLALSDPNASYATVQWGQVTGTRTWTNMNATIIWADTTTDLDLAA
jgi:hypothetical protein